MCTFERPTSQEVEKSMQFVISAQMKNVFCLFVGINQAPNMTGSSHFYRCLLICMKIWVTISNDLSTQHEYKIKLGGSVKHKLVRGMKGSIPIKYLLNGLS